MSPSWVALSLLPSGGDGSKVFNALLELLDLPKLVWDQLRRSLLSGGAVPRLCAAAQPSGPTTLPPAGRAEL